MYKNYYHMSEEPFQNYPVPDLFFKSRSHQSGWRYLLLGIKAREPYLMVTGEYGAGKTLLCLRLLKGMLQKPDYFPHVFVSTPNSSYVDILKKIGSALGVSAGKEGESALQRVILEEFERQEPPGPFFLILDDVQDIDAKTLYNLRLFANFSCNGVFPIRLILFAHTSFLQRLKSSTLIALDQRIKRRFHLASLEPEETKEYIYFRLLNSGARGRPFFDDGGIQRIHDVSGGVPRVINNLCDACLLIGAGEDLGVIEEWTVRRAEAYLGMSREVVMETPAGKPASERSHGGNSQEGSTALDHSSQEDPWQQPGEGGDFAGMPDIHQSEKLEQVVSGWEKETLPGFGFGRDGFFSTRKGRYLLVALLVVLVFLFGFFWQRYSVGVTLGLTSTSSALPAPVDGEIALWLEPKGSVASGPEVGLNKSLPKTVESVPVAEEVEDIDAHAPLIMAVDTGRPGQMPGEPVERESVLDGKHEFLGTEVVCVPKSEYTLVVSSCRKRESALAVLGELGDDFSRYQAGLGLIAYGGGSPWWVVHRGAFASRKEAIAARRLLNIPDALVRKLPYFEVKARYKSSPDAIQQCRVLKARGEHPFIVDEGDWIDVCLGRYDTVERAEAQATVQSHSNGGMVASRRTPLR